MSNIETLSKHNGGPWALPAKEKPPHEPRVGSRRIIRMILHRDNQELPVQALLDSASEGSMLQLYALAILL
jgi:hypothetical protein